MRPRLSRAIDWLVGSDPGLNRLRMASDAVLSIGLAILFEYCFVEATGALQAPTINAGALHASTINAAAAASNHDLLVIAMTIGAIIGNVSSLGVNDPTLRARLISLAFIPVPLVAALAFGLALGGHRTLVLSSFAVLLGLAGLARRWGSRGVSIGVPLFIGDFYGYFLHRTVPLADIWWLAAEAALGAAACAVVQLLVIRPGPAAALRRSQRSWRVLARAVAEAALAYLGAATPDRRRRAAALLDRRLAQLAESSLIIDAQLAEPGAAPRGSSARRLHERLFEAELGITNMARFGRALAETDIEPAMREAVVAALRAAAADDARGASEAGHAILDRLGEQEPDLGAGWRTRVLLHRFASSVALVGEALEEWTSLGDRSGPEDFTPAAQLAGPWLPGTAEVSNLASSRGGGRWYERLALPRYVRTAIQMTVAVAAATAAGVAFDPQRFYWAVIAVFVAFTGANTSMEQLRKALRRVVGTLGGIALGSVIAHAAGLAVGPDVAVILVSLFAGVYLIRVNYGFFVVGLTVTLTMLYEQFHEYSPALLVTRLEETAIGAGCAVVVSLLVLPLRTERVLDVAVDEELEAVKVAVDAAVAGLGHGTDRRPLADAARGVDNAFQAVASAAAPLRRLGPSGRRAQALLAAAGALRHYSRNLADDVPGAGAVDDPPPEFSRAAARLSDSLGALLSGRTDATYTRSAAEWSVVEQTAVQRMRRAVEHEGHLAGDAVALALSARDFQLLDGTLATIAGIRGLAVVGTDTDRPPAVPVPAADSATGARG